MTSTKGLKLNVTFISDGACVTRWIDCIFKIWPFSINKICLLSLKLCQSRFKIMPNIKLTQQKLPKTFAILTKWRYYAKSGHTGWRLKCLPSIEFNNLTNTLHYLNAASLKCKNCPLKEKLVVCCLITKLVNFKCKVFTCP